jgi:hypothetical protein
MKFPLTLLLLAPLAFAASLRSDPAAPNAVHLAFSDPSKPGTVDVQLLAGKVDIAGADVSDVAVETDAAPGPEPRRSDGMRVLSTSAGLSYSEKNNVLKLRWNGFPEHRHAGRFRIVVPRATSVVVSSSVGGDVTCEGVSGDVEIHCLNGAVRVDGLRGSLSVETLNGAIHAKLDAVQPGKAVSLSSMNGAVTVEVPAAAKANIHLRTHNGSVLTDFDEKALVTTSESAGIADTPRARRSMPPLPPMTGGKVVSGTLNGGGADLQVTTMNGDITLRKSPQG